VIVDPAWAAVDIAISLSKSEIVKSGFESIVGLHLCPVRVFTGQEIDLC
jgi:hypothetical protein